MYTDLSKLCINQDTTIDGAVKCLDLSRLGIVLVVDGQRRLIGTITDGDIRRAILAHIDFSQPVSLLLARKANSAFAKPIATAADVKPETWLRLLQQHSIVHLPLLDENERVVGLVTRDDFLPGEPLPLRAVVMAGGAGRRLQPLTDETPKPMLPVGDRPMMEIILERLRTSGIRRVNVTVHHQAEKITRHFGNGNEFGVELNYVAEDRPLGTAGALGLMEKPQETLLVINGDILTQVDFRAMLAYHQESKADLTVAVSRLDLQVPYGVVECEGSAVRQLTEKPTFGFFVNAGIYLIEPSAHGYIPNGRRFDMTELIQLLIDEGRSVVSFPIREYWLDIGSHDDYLRAQETAKTWKQSP